MLKLNGKTTLNPAFVDIKSTKNWPWNNFLKNVEYIIVKNLFCMSLYKYSKLPVHRDTQPEYNTVSIIEKTKYDLLPLVLGLL